MEKLLLIVIFLLKGIHSVWAQEDSSGGFNEPILIESEYSGFSDYFDDETSQEEFFLDKIANFRMMASFIDDDETEGGAQSPVIEEMQFDALGFEDDSETGLVSETPILEMDDRLEADELDERLYGPSQYDSRIETRALNPLIKTQHSILETTESVGMIVENSKLNRITDSTYQLEIVAKLGEYLNLCPGEAFASQPVIGSGTAFIVGDSSMITASHVFEGNPTDYSVVFGFEILNQLGTYEVFIPFGNVYTISGIEHIDIELDVVQFKTNEKITRRSLELDLDVEHKPGDKIYMVGFPMGLPQKVAVNASIRADDSAFHYYTTLDAFRGNSGSPVFDLDTKKVIGVLVSGGKDYEWNGECNQAVNCSYPSCLGERVVKIKAFQL